MFYRYYKTMDTKIMNVTLKPQKSTFFQYQNPARFNP